MQSAKSRTVMPESPSDYVELVSAIVVGVVSVGSAIAGLGLGERPRGWWVLVIFLVFFLPTFGLLLTAICYRGKITRIITIPLVVVGLLPSVFFLFIWVVLLFSQLFNQIPDPRGELRASDNEQLPVAASVIDYTLKFQRDADYCEVSIRPQPQDRTRVKQIDVNGLSVANSGDKSRFVRHYLEGEAMTVEIDVRQPSRSLNATAQLRVTGDNQWPLKLRVTYQYWGKTKWWRLRQWVFREFGSQ